MSTTKVKGKIFALTLLVARTALYTDLKTTISQTI